MKKVISFLQNVSSGKTVLFTIILTMAVYLFMLFYSIPKVESFAPKLALFDLSPSGYSYEHAILLLESLGKTGRNLYLSLQLPADFFYPGLFAISYSLLLNWVFKKSFNSKSNIFYLTFVPVIGGLFDYLENICILRMIKLFPDFPKQLVVVASTFTVIKSIFSTIFFFLLFGGIIAILISHLKQKKELKDESSHKTNL